MFQNANSGQTFASYSRSLFWRKLLHRRRYARRVLSLVPVGELDLLAANSRDDASEKIKGTITRGLEAFFHGMNVDWMTAADDSTVVNFRDIRCTKRTHSRTGRVQYLVGDVLAHLKSIIPSRSFCLVGVTIEDLFPSHEWNFVFGHALPGDLTGVVSVARYANKESNDSDLIVSFSNLLWRLFKVLTHEICHLFGLKHCRMFPCAMNESRNLEEAISQPLFLCPVCLRKLHHALEFSLLSRYQALFEFISSIVETFDDEDILICTGKTELESPPTENTVEAPGYGKRRFFESLAWLKSTIDEIENKINK